MRAHLTLIDTAGSRQLPLGKESATFGNDPAATLRFQAPGPATVDATLRWNARQATWMIAPTPGAQVAINGRLLGDSGSTALANQDVIELPAKGTMAHFYRQPEDPTFGDKPVAELALDGTSLIFGRADTALTRASSPNRVELDPEDGLISKTHAVLERENGAFVLSDHSKFGTELNGKEFGRAKLVFGDRFKIRDYIFEFTGTSVRRVDHGGVGRISARDVSVEVAKQGGTLRILNGVSFDVRAGEFIGILGGSGQGKSTLLNALCGIQPPTGGEVFISGIPVTDRRRLRTAGVGFVPQDDIVHRELTVQQAITYSARLRLELPPEQTKDLVDRVIERLSLTEHREKVVSALSGGQRKRVSIAIELLARPSVLFLDEPSSGLDPATEADLMVMLQSLRLTNLTVVCTTHMLQRAFLFDRVAFIHGGRLVFLGTADEAREHFLMKGTANAALLLDRSPLDKIYSLLADSAKAKPDSPAHKTPEEWEQEFRESRFASGLALAPPVVEAGATAAPPTAAAGERAGYLKTLGLLLARQWRILLADRLNLLFLLAQALAIGALVGWVAEDAALRMFLCVVATLWFGCSNGAQQIVSELAIFRRERVCGLGIGVYVQSKLLFLTLLTFVQAVLLFGMIFSAAHVFHPEKFDPKEFQARLIQRIAPSASPDAGTDDFAAEGDPTPASAAANGPKSPLPAPPGPTKLATLTWLARTFYLQDNLLDSGPRELRNADGEAIVERATGKPQIEPGLSIAQVLWLTLGLKAAALLGATLVGVSLGLAISAFVRTPTQAVMWVPLILIPQILFGGFVVRAPEMSAAVLRFSRAVPSFCVQRVMDVSNIFGQATPMMSNRTEQPLFLTGGEKKSVEWNDGAQALGRSYDKAAFFNASWQNLLVIRDWVGQTDEVVENNANGTSDHPRDTTKARRDVIYEKGVVFRTWREGQISLLTLGIWVLLCHGATILSLSRKQTGH